MKYSLATNFDNRLIEALSPLKSIHNVYGKLPYDIMGGGRPSYILPQINMGQLKDHIRCCHEHGIKFNYLLNALCLNNEELSRKSARMFHFIDRVLKAGADEVTIANTVLLRMFRKHYPEIPISLSMFQGVDSLPAFIKMEEQGIQEITLHFTATRNFPLLRKLVEESKPETRIRLIANNSCIKDCVDNRNHGIFNSHNSRGGAFSKPAFRLEPFRIGCDLQKIENPTRFISSPWIRPEDVPLYDEIGKEKIILKLTDRSCPTDWLIRTARAYSRQSYRGNLMDLLNFPGNQTVLNVNRKAGIMGVLKGYVHPRQMPRVIKALRLMPVHIENSALEGFLKGMAEKDCHNLQCDDRGWGETSTGGRGCGYCRKFAEAAVTMDETKRLEMIEHNQTIMDKIHSGAIFSA